MKYQEFDEIELKDGRTGAIVDKMGPYYVVDVGSSPKDWDTIVVKESDIVKKKGE